MSWDELRKHLDQLNERLTKNLELAKKLDRLEDEANALDTDDEAGQAIRAVIEATIRGVLEGEIARWQKIAAALAVLLGLALLALFVALAL